MKYFMKSKFFKLKEDFWIKNEQEEDYFFVDTKLISLGSQFSISKNDNIMYSVKQKLLSFMPSYDMFESNSEEIMATIKQEFTFFNRKINIESKYGSIKIMGDIFGYDYEIVKDGKQIATVSKEIFAFTDNYIIDVDFEDEAFVVCLAVIIDDLIDKSRSNY